VLPSSCSVVITRAEVFPSFGPGARCHVETLRSSPAVAGRAAELGRSITTITVLKAAALAGISVAKARREGGPRRLAGVTKACVRQTRSQWRSMSQKGTYSRT
jgi:hypothetical protein